MIRIRSYFLIALTLSTVIATRLSAQCMMSCPTADEVSVQAQLDATALAGGGVVEITQPVLNVCGPLVVGSNTHLRGSTRGGTTVRAVTGFAGKVVSNSTLVAVIGTVGTTNVTISDLTADINTCDVHSNVIALLPASSTPASEYDGTVVTNATVERVEIHGAPGYHSYMIWNLRGQHIRYLNNWIDGHSTSIGVGQEGMESYGGYDVLMLGNTVLNIGNSCVIIGSGNGEIPNANTNSIRVVDNYLSGCTTGINVTVAFAIGTESTSHTLLRGNVIVDSRSFGIDAPVFVGTFQRDLQITGNTIRNIPNALSAGIRLWTVAGQLIAGSGVIGTLVQGNHVENVSGANSFGIQLHRYPNARLLDNTIIGTGSEGIRVYDSGDTEVVGNRISMATSNGIAVHKSASYTSARVIVERNRIDNWSPTTSGIIVLGTSRGTVKDNVFSRGDAAVPSPITLASGTCGMSVSGNVPWYLATYTQPTSPACP